MGKGYILRRSPRSRGIGDGPEEKQTAVDEGLQCEQKCFDVRLFLKREKDVDSRQKISKQSPD